MGCTWKVAKVQGGQSVAWKFSIITLAYQEPIQVFVLYAQGERLISILSLVIIMHQIPPGRRHAQAQAQCFAPITFACPCFILILIYRHRAPLRSDSFAAM